VLAAGRGERLWPLTENRPKHLLPVGGRPVIERTLRSLSKSGVRDVVLVINFREDKIRQEIGNGRHLGCDITYVRQRRIAGTADAIKAAKAELDREDIFLVVYGDDYYSEDALSRMVKKAARADDMMIATAIVENSARFGSLTISHGLVRSIREKHVKGRGLVNAGIYLLSKSIFPVVAKTRKSLRNEYELTDSLEEMLRQGQRLSAFRLEKGEWVGISYPWDLLEANRLALDKRRPSVAGKVEAGANLRGSVEVERGAVVKSGSYLEGPVFVGEGAVVGPNSYLRPHTSLGRNVKVGSSCEVKNSIVMANTTIPHLSYVGDSIIGENCSLGAGTVTANLRFDEATVRSVVKGALVDSRRKKLGAVLGDGVRTGVNVSLLPGVKVGAGAWVGPGAVVKRDVPSRARITG